MKSLVVADLTNPTNEPFAVLLVDTEIRMGSGVKATVISKHWTRADAEEAASFPIDSVRGQA